MTYALGIDFGTESARALVVDVRDGTEAGEFVYEYDHGVLDERLPGGAELEADWALQDPRDYVRAVQHVVPRALADEIAGVGIAFTSCTMLPTLRDGTPLCAVEDLRDEPHAWAKLWKHHAAQPEADRINEVAAERGEPWLGRYGGSISSEWFFAKALQILDEAPHVYARSERLVEAADWITWQLTGVETRNACTAGYKAMWSKRDGFPSTAYFAALDPRFADVVDTRMSRALSSPGSLAGRAAPWTGLRPGTPVAVGGVDFHVSVPAVAVAEPGTLVLIMGTSCGHLLLGDVLAEVEGMCGVVEDGIVPGLFGYEAGQSGFGDVFGWYARHVGITHADLARDAAALRPGGCGLLALEWWNGNRSVLVDADLSGLLVGATLSTRPHDVYRALLEGAAFGTRMIVEAFRSGGLVVDSLVACGGVAERNPLLLQIVADVTGLEIDVAASRQTPALGAAMWGAVAAGAGTIDELSQRMTRASSARYLPRTAHRAAYDTLFAAYRRLHDHFGRGGDDIMRTLRRLQRASP